MNTFSKISCLALALTACTLSSCKHKLKGEDMGEVRGKVVDKNGFSITVSATDGNTYKFMIDRLTDVLGGVSMIDDSVKVFYIGSEVTDSTKASVIKLMPANAYKPHPLVGVWRSPVNFDMELHEDGSASLLGEDTPAFSLSAWKKQDSLLVLTGLRDAKEFTDTYQVLAANDDSLILVNQDGSGKRLAFARTDQKINK